jgi:hypothetical protein
MPALIWSNTANPAFLLQLLDYFLDTGMAQSKRIHHFLNGYSLFLPNHLQYFLPTFLPTFLPSFRLSFGRKRDDGDKGVSFNELGLGALGVQGQVLADVQDTRPEYISTSLSYWLCRLHMNQRVSLFQVSTVLRSPFE